jgi:hypothetical protein
MGSHLLHAELPRRGRRGRRRNSQALAGRRRQGLRLDGLPRHPHGALARLGVVGSAQLRARHTAHQPHTARVRPDRAPQAFPCSLDAQRARVLSIQGGAQWPRQEGMWVGVAKARDSGCRCGVGAGLPSRPTCSNAACSRSADSAERISAASEGASGGAPAASKRARAASRCPRVLLVCGCTDGRSMRQSGHHMSRGWQPAPLDKAI